MSVGLRRAYSLARAEAGFGLIEVLVAAVVLTAGILALAGSVGSSKRLTTVGERKEVASHVAEQEIERLLSQGYASLATTDPGPASDPPDPRYYVRSTCQGGSGPCYQWNQGDPPSDHNTEPLVISSSAQSAGPVPWSAGELSGNFYRFVTWVDDPCSACSSADQSRTTDYKRITVGVTVSGSSGPKNPVLISTIATDPSEGSG